MVQIDWMSAFSLFQRPLKHLKNIDLKRSEGGRRSFLVKISSKTLKLFRIILDFYLSLRVAFYWNYNATSKCLWYYKLSHCRTVVVSHYMQALKLPHGTEVAFYLLHSNAFCRMIKRRCRTSISFLPIRQPFLQIHNLVGVSSHFWLVSKKICTSRSTAKWRCSALDKHCWEALSTNAFFQK